MSNDCYIVRFKGHVCAAVQDRTEPETDSPAEEKA